MSPQHRHLQHYSDRRFKLFDRMHDGAACLIPSGEKKFRNGDAEYPFRQNSDLYYLTGWPEDQTLMLMLAKDGKRQSILFCSESDEVEARWIGKRIGLEGAKKDYGLDEVYPLDHIETLLPELLSGTHTLYYPIGVSSHLEDTIRKTIQTIQKLKRQGWSAPNQFVELRALLDDMRLFKMGDEMARMRKAASVSAHAHTRAMKVCQPGMYEYEIEAELRHEFLKHGAHDVAYLPIVASGPNACVLHYVQNARKMQEGELLLIDAGCEYQGYAADITRTFPVNGKFSAPQQAIYELVLASQEAAIEKAHPDHTWDKMQEVILQVLVQGLVDLSILKGDVSGLIEKGAYRPYYMHQSGHWLGLDVHDVGEYKPNGTWRPLQPGMVLTVEPGLYLPEDDLNLPEAYRGIGVRIEDDILVTDHGADVISKEAPKTVADIEKVMAKSS